jgi:hypothetical protein
MILLPRYWEYGKLPLTVKEILCSETYGKELVENLWHDLDDARFNVVTVVVMVSFFLWEVRDDMFVQNVS